MKTNADGRNFGDTLDFGCFSGVVERKNGRTNSKPHHSYLRTHFSQLRQSTTLLLPTNGERGGMVVRELIHLQQGPQDQLPVQPFSFLEGALCGKLL